MQVFHFGAIRPHPRAPGTVGAHALHVECPWRILDGGHLLTGQSDSHEPPGADRPVAHDDHRAGTLRDVHLSRLLGGFDAATRSHVDADGRLTVIATSCDRHGTAEIVLTGQIRLQLFPDGAGENWRLFAPGGAAPHLVVEGGVAACD